VVNPLVRFNASRLVHGACLAVLALAAGRVLPAQAPPATAPTWARAVEGQRKADLGNGTFLNPIMAGERWWSKGHATIFEGPGGQWYAVYLAHENGFYNLGRQTLVEPMAWTADGWLARTAGSRGRLARAGGWLARAGADVAAPIRKPAGPAVPHGMALSDDFSTSKMGTQWSFYKGTASDTDRAIATRTARSC